MAEEPGAALGLNLPLRVPPGGESRQTERRLVFNTGDDPIFVGADGLPYEVRGEARRTFNLLTTPELSLNAQFVKVPVQFRAEDITGTRTSMHQHAPTHARHAPAASREVAHSSAHPAPHVATCTLQARLRNTE